MFTENIFFQNIYGKDKYEILETIGKELKAKDYVDDTFIESVLNRERLSSTCFTPGLAIPHAISSNVKKALFLLPVINGT